MAERAYVALGSNLGARASYLAAARSAMSLLPATRLAAASSVEETAAFGPAQGPYLNQMAVLETALAPHALLRALLGIERALGRVRRERWGARTIDLDLVRMGERRIETATLVLPHPGLATRDFWRRELVELDTLLARAA